jgi:hypothetical protein
VVTERRDWLRAADADRQFVAERLRAALDEGRLDLSEYDERLQRTYAAKTYGELDQLLDDLPTVVGGQQSVIAPQPTGEAGTHPTSGTPGTPPPPGDPRRRASSWLLATWGGWLSTSLLCTVIYLLSDPGGYPWPLWIAGPWGITLLVYTMKAFASGDPHGYAAVERERGQQRRTREQFRREARWQRRQDRWR